MCGKVGQDLTSSPVSVTSSTFEEVGEESTGNASGLDLTSTTRPGSSEVRGGAAVSRGRRLCCRCLRVSRGPQPRRRGPYQHAVEKAALSVERVLMALAQKARPCLKTHY